jgi:hypothetical protein
MSVKTVDLTAQNTFSAWLKPIKRGSSGFDSEGFLDIMTSGTWAGTLTVQKRHFHGTPAVYTDPYDVEDFTANLTKLIEDRSTTVEYRIGFKTGGYGSGTAAVRLEQ